MAEPDDVIRRLDRIEAGMVTKTDLADTIGIEIAVINRLLRQTTGNLDSLRSEVRVLGATMRQLAATVNGLADVIQALAASQMQLDDRLRRLEE